MLKVERFLYVVTAFIYSGAVVTLGLEDGAPFFLEALARVSVPFVFLTVIVILIRNKLIGTVVSRAFEDKSLLLLVGIAVCSVTWSIDPSGSLRHVILYVGAVGIGLYWAVRFPLATQLRLLEYLFLVVAALSIATVFLAPSYGLQEQGGAEVWKGVFNNRNRLGRFMALAIIVSMYRPASVGAWRRWSYIAFFSIPLYFTASKSAAVLAVFGVLCYPVFRQLRLAPKLLVSAGAVGSLGLVGASIWTVSNFSEIIRWLGRDVTLSGRTFIWLEAIGFIYQRPVLGYGMGGFFLLLEQGQLVSEWASSAHNGYLETALSMGGVGLVALVTYLLLNLSRSLKLIRRTRGRVGYWPVTFLLFVIVYSFVESILFKNYNLIWTLVVSTTVSMNRELRRRRSEVRAV